MLKQKNNKYSTANKSLIIGISAFSLLTTSFFSNADSKEYQLKPAASIQMSSDAYEVKLGMGAWSEGNSVHTQFYVSHFKAEDTLKVNGVSRYDQKYTSTRLGIGVDASGFFGPESDNAFQGGVFLYSNKSQENIDRYGLGAALTSGAKLTKKLRIQTGVEIMPEFLSTNWDAKAVLEYELNTGATYRITPKIEADLIYRYGGTLDAINVKHYRQLMFGLSLKL